MSGFKVSSPDYQQVHFSLEVLDLAYPMHNWCSSCGCTTSEMEKRGFVIFRDLPICLPCWEEPLPEGYAEDDLPF